MCNAFSHVAGAAANFAGALRDTINDNNSPFLMAPITFAGKFADKERKRISKIHVNEELEKIPDLVADAISAAPIEDQVRLVKAQKQSNWSIWTNIG